MSTDEEKLWNEFEKILRDNEDLIPKDLVKNLNALFESRTTLSKKLGEIISKVEDQELAMKITKGTLAGTGVLGTILLFTPLAPLGAAVLGVSAAGATVVSITDLIITAVREGDVEDLLKKDDENAKNLIKDFEKINSLAAYFVEKEIVTTIEEGNKYAFAFSVAMNFVNLAQSLIGQYKTLKTLFTNGMRFVSTADKQALGFISRASGVLSAGLLILDFVLALLIDNPVKAKAQQAKSTIDESLNKIRKIKDIVEQISAHATKMGGA